MLSRSRRQSTAPTTFHGDERRDQTYFWKAFVANSVKFCRQYGQT
jgi:hypothetical protein